MIFLPNLNLTATLLACVCPLRSRDASSFLLFLHRVEKRVVHAVIYTIMDVDIQLTPGACEMMLTTTEGDLSANAPRVQCISFKLLTMATDSAPDRYRYVHTL